MIDYKELIAALRSPAVFISDGGMADGSHVSQQAAGTIEALAARVAELEKALEWHPIATALKDGTEIQLKLKDQDSSITAFYDYSEEWPEYVWATLDGPRYPRAAFDAWANVPPFRSALKPKE